MNLRFVETSRERNVLFAVELLDAVTLERVNRGITLEAQGLRRSPITNFGGLFVWIKQTPQEDTTALRSLVVTSGELPYQSITLDASQVQVPRLTISLAPRVNYPFQAGVTGVRGTLIESTFGTRRPVLDATVRLQWIDPLNDWINSPPVSNTAADKGDFVAILRLLPADKPDLNTTDGTMQVRLQADRPTAMTRYSAPFNLIPGRLADPIRFAWDDLQP